MPFPKEIREKKPRKGLSRKTQMSRGTKLMNKRGRRGEERLAVSRELTEKFQHEPWFNSCEIKYGLIKRGLISGDELVCWPKLTWAHCSKHRDDNAPLGDPKNHYTAARGCTRHHYYVLDIPSRVPVEVAAEIVLEAIKRRSRLRTA